MKTVDETDIHHHRDSVQQNQHTQLQEPRQGSDQDISSADPVDTHKGSHGVEGQYHCIPLA